MGFRRDYTGEILGLESIGVAIKFLGKGLDGYFMVSELKDGQPVQFSGLVSTSKLEELRDLLSDYLQMEQDREVAGSEGPDVMPNWYSIRKIIGKLLP